MDIVQFANSLRLTIFSLLTVLVVAACAPEDSNKSSSQDESGPPSNALKIVPPADRLSEATGMLTIVSPGQASASGGAGAYSFSHDAPANGFPLGATTVTWTVVDGAGAASSAAQMIMMSDTTAPDISVPPGMQVASTATTTVIDLGTATITDMVDPNPNISNNSPANGFPQGTTMVTWMGTDASGNVSLATQMVTVSPLTPGGLTLTAPAAITMEATAPATPVSLGMAIANGGVAPFTITNNEPAGGFPVGTTTVIWTVVDAAMASITATQAITITDTTAPSITAPANVAVNQGPGPGNTNVNLGTPTFSDLADPNPVVSNNEPANGYPVGSTTVVWTALDASGNSASDTQLVTINGAFSITPPGPITMEATGPLTSVTLGTATASGGSAPFTISNDEPAGGYPVGVTMVNWTAVDAAMASAMGTQAITITDTTAPSITAPADVSADQGQGLGNTNVNLGTPTFSDLADPNPVVSNNAPANGFPAGNTVVVWMAIDASGNSAIDTQVVTINAFAAELCSTMVSEFTTAIYPLMANPARCSGCHVGSAPLPTTNGWGFPNNPPGADDFDLFRTIAAIDLNGQSLILAKATASVGHSGGDRFPGRPNDPDYDLFADFVNRAAVCQLDPPTSARTIDIGTGYEQLHRITAALGARTPTVNEINTISAANNDQPAIDAALGPIMDGLMNEDAFYTRVQEMYNDLLLTDKDANDRGNVDDNFDLDAFANRDYYEDNFSGNERSDLREAANYGFARAPVELVKYVIQNNRPFTEIVTADYTMINPYSAVIYNNNAGDPSFLFSSDQNQANHDRDDFRPVNNIRQQDNTLVPAAGVIGTHAFLSRYPSTNTNVNRARSRYVYDYFLGLDIESLAPRDGLNLDNVIGSVPTFEDPQCTVCHIVMDPIAGLFTNRDNDGEYDPGNTFQHTRTTNGVPRMVPAGYSLLQADQLPGSEEDTALQWLGGRLAQDDRFAERTVRTVFKGLTGIDATAASTTAFVNDTKNRFVAANFNFKLLVKDIVASDYFMARNLAVGEDPDDYTDIGAGRLITPEELNRKISDITGINYEWRGPNSNSGLLGRHRLLYGGIDSDDVIQRITEPTSLIDGIQERIANQVACQRVANDLYNSGALFPFADETDFPDGGAGENAIRQNIQFLHRHILGEDLALNDTEIDNTYQLFVDVRSAGQTAIQSQCRGGGGSNDNNGTVIPWMAVVTYLLADYRFLYE
jgi:hypothetical protein